MNILLNKKIISLRSAYAVYFDPKVMTLLFFGFASGLPFMLVFSSLSFWLREAQVERAAIGFFSWVGLSYAFKWIWAPFIDRCSLPLLSHWFGRRRGWLLLSQCFIIVFLVCMSCTDPAVDLWYMAVFALGLAFSSATQDIVIDAYRIESAPDKLQAAMAATYQIGYRIAMIVSGAGVLAIAAFAGSNTDYNLHGWKVAYLCMAAVFVIGIITTFVVSEPKIGSLQRPLEARAAHWLNHYDHLPTMVKRPVAWLYGVVLCPFIDFFSRHRWHALLLLLLVGTYRISDIVMGVMANPFYHDIGFSKEQIASIIKVYGVIMTLVGASIGGILINRFGVMKILFVGALLSCLSNSLFAWLAHVGPSVRILTFVISIDNLSGGLATSSFVAWLSSLTNVNYSATQYAMFSSIMLLFPKLIAGFSGVTVDHIGYTYFFIGSSLIGLPVLLLVVLAGRYLNTK